MNKALLIGIGERGKNDCQMMLDFLKSQGKETQVTVMCDKEVTTEAITKRFKEIIDDLKPEDSVVMHFSGPSQQEKPLGEDFLTLLQNENEGIQFYDMASKREMWLRMWNGDGLWLFFKHPDGQWVSLRKTKRDDIDKVFNAYCEFHKPTKYPNFIIAGLPVPPGDWSECPECASKPGSPVLCQKCLDKRDQCWALQHKLAKDIANMRYFIERLD